MPPSWTFAVAKDDLTATTVHRHDAPGPSDGEALLRVDRVGVTANNVTYAVLGEQLGYWRFFPPDARGLDATWGLPPVWGFAEVTESRAVGVEPGLRVYGYLPPGGHLLVRPGRVDERGFRDTAGHRAGLPSPYNAYAATGTDAAHRDEDEDLLVLFRPLFFTSFMLADRLTDTGHGADVLVLSSASSKTAYAAAFELHGRGPELVGLTSPGNAAFTRGLGCYDRVLTYDEIDALDPARPTAHLDLSGHPGTRAAIRAHLGDRLVLDLAVGLTSQVPNAADAGAVFFAPDQMRKRTADWGRDGLDRRFAAAWHRFAAFARDQVDVAAGRGSDGLAAAWTDVVTGRAAPRTGHVLSFAPEV
jgi:hypothetical protein